MLKPASIILACVAAAFQAGRSTLTKGSIDPSVSDAIPAVVLAAIIEREKPDAILPTVGGQTALNLAVALGENGTLEKYGVELIGASVPAIKIAEDRLLFRDAMRAIGADVPESRYVKSIEEALGVV